MATGGDMDKLMETLEEMKTCSVCKEKFNNPKILKCHHTFCRSCIDSLIQSCNDNFFSCPLCRVKCFYPREGADKLPTCTYIQDLLDVESQDKRVSKESEKINCKVCSDNPREATHVCIDCESPQNHLCTECMTYHQKFCKIHTVTSMHDFKNSSISSALEMKKKDKRCVDHNDKVEFLCLTCDKQICVNCAVIEHEGHKKETVAKLADSVRDTMAKIEMDIKPLIEYSKEEISDLKSKMKALNDATKDQERKIKEYVKSLHKVIDEKEVISIEELNQTKDNQDRKITEVKEEAETNLARKESLLQYMQSLKKFGNDSHLIEERDNIQGRWEQIQQLKVSVDVTEEHTSIFFQRDEALEKELQTSILGKTDIYEIPSGKDLDICSINGSMESDIYDGELTDSKTLETDVNSDTSSQSELPDLYASSSNDSMPPRTTRVVEGISLITSLKTDIKVTGFALTKKNEIIVVSHISKKCFVYKSTTSVPIEIVEKLVGPWDAAVAENKERKEIIYITDTGDGSVKTYLKDGAFLDTLTTGLKKPHGIAVSANGDVYVCDAEERNVVIVPPGKQPTRKLKQFGQSWLFQRSSFQCPWYITISSTGDKIVSDFAAKELRIIKGNSTIVSYGAQTSADLKEFQPAKSCVHPNGYILVVNQGGNTIHVLNSNGTHLRVLKSKEIPVSRPIGLAFDSNANLWIVSKNGKIVQIDIDFRKLLQYTNVELQSNA